MFGVAKRRRVVLMFDKNDPKSVSRTKQSFKKECDINTIVAKALKTGMVNANLKEGVYGDFTNGNDFEALQNKLISAQRQFEALPAELRAKFEHSPAKLVDYLADEKNHPEAVSLKLMEKTQKMIDDEKAAQAAAEAARKAALPPA